MRRNAETVWYFIAGWIAGAVGILMFLRWYGNKHGITAAAEKEGERKEK